MMQKTKTQINRRQSARRRFLLLRDPLERYRDGPSAAGGDRGLLGDVGRATRVVAGHRGLRLSSQRHLERFYFHRVRLHQARAKQEGQDRTGKPRHSKRMAEEHSVAAELSRGYVSGTAHGKGRGQCSLTWLRASCVRRAASTNTRWW